MISTVLRHSEEKHIARLFPTPDLILTFGLSHPSHTPGLILGRLREEGKTNKHRGLPRGSDAMLCLGGGHPPKRFSAITCAIWLRLIFRGRGSAWFFGAHLLFFHARGRILEAGVGFWNPEVDILARGPFWPQKMVPKKKVL